MDSNQSRKMRIFFSAAEASGDRLCANLIEALKKTPGDIEFLGVGGPRMAQAGCKLLANSVDRAAMIYKAFGHVLFFYKLIKQIRKYLKENQVDIVIVCDSPSFNFHVAKAAKKLGIKTLFYVAPQLWAWGQWRIKKLKRLCDNKLGTLACTLPFEPEWFGKRGLDCQFVGSPLLEDIAAAEIEPRQYTDYNSNSPKIALMPGSRTAEIKSLWQSMQLIAQRIKAGHTDAGFTVVAVDQKTKNLLKQTQIPGFRCEYSVDSVFETAGKVDFTIVASGSATLQVAAAACPMVIMYQSNKYLWHLVGRWIIKTKHLSLVNILARDELVPEFMPYFTSIAPISTTCKKMLKDRERLASTSAQLAELVLPLVEKDASQDTARIVLKFIETE